MTALQAIHAFWSSFGIPAYDVNTVPDNAQLPYITYDVSNDYFDAEIMQVASIWYRSTSWTEITAKEQEIAEYIGRGGRNLICDGGAVWIKRRSPWAQRMADPSDSMIRRIVLNIEMEFIF